MSRQPAVRKRKPATRKRKPPTGTGLEKFGSELPAMVAAILELPYVAIGRFRDRWSRKWIWVAAPRFVVGEANVWRWSIVAMATSIEQLVAMVESTARERDTERMLRERLRRQLAA